MDIPLEIVQWIEFIGTTQERAHLQYILVQNGGEK
ncbi:hypothetical protein SAMN05421863_101251 [Nitrosomonas communis]|uniref:Uncharacterized protein n=1 Tax=Nitrosomonas communis TaxID=44574 RepID=A0A1I4MYQ9_9PROT|nr:hypothetical protein SAMN05421863_101251 [Nitrosomonas communis]